MKLEVTWYVAVRYSARKKEWVNYKKVNEIAKKHDKNGKLERPILVGSSASKKTKHIKYMYKMKLTHNTTSMR